MQQRNGNLGFAEGDLFHRFGDLCIVPKKLIHY
jgi:hypothetical protein